MNPKLQTDQYHSGPIPFTGGMREFICLSVPYYPPVENDLFWGATEEIQGIIAHPGSPAPGCKVLVLVRLMV